MDLFFKNLTRFFAFFVFSILARDPGVAGVSQPAHAEQIRLRLPVHPEWNPVTQKFGALVPIFGTLVTSIIALLIGIPVSFGIALFLTELSPLWLKRPARHGD